MGITWSMEVVSFLFKSNFQDPSTAFIWYITDALNALYGLVIFVIFALKNKVNLWAPAAPANHKPRTAHLAVSRRKQRIRNARRSYLKRNP